MKTWIKYLIGIILGVAAALILPMSNQTLSDAFTFVSELFIRSSSYILFPLIFCSACVSAFKLKSEKTLRQTSVWTVLTIITTSIILVFVGLLAILVIKLPRIPISIEKVSSVTSLDLISLIKQILPYSVFTAFTESYFVLPIFLFALAIGYVCAKDSNESRPITTLMDSFSKVFYKIMTFFTEIFAVGLIAISACWTIQFRSVLMQGIYTPLILLLLGIFVFISVIVYPLILYLVCKDPRPFRVLYASLPAIFTAFISGNTNATLPVLIRHSKDSLGEQRRLTAFTLPLFSTFARGGVALVTVVSFIVIWRSYSSLSITLPDLLWFITVTFALSFVLGNMPSGGVFFAITIVCTMYSRGFETGYLLLRPVALILGSFATAFDAVTAMFGSYFVSVKTKQIRHKEWRNFI